MSIPAEHTVTVTLNGQTIPVLSGTLRHDTTKAPAITANLTVPATPALLALDPQRDLIWATITVTVNRKKFYRVRHMASLIPGISTIAQFTTAYLGKKISDITTSAAIQSKTWTLQLRAVRERWADATIDLTLKSAEALLIDLFNPTGYNGVNNSPQLDLPTTSILAAAQKLATVCGLGTITSYPPVAGSSAITDVQKRWRRGISAWDQLQVVLRDKNLLARPDGSTIKLILETTAATNDVTLTDGANGTILDGGQVIDRDDPDFAHVIVGGTQPAWLSHPSLPDVDRDYLGGISTVARKQTSPYPHATPPYKTLRSPSDSYTGWGMYIGPTANAYHRGRGWDVAIVADYTIDPDTLAHVTAQGSSFDARVRGVEHAWPANTSRLDLVETYNPTRAEELLLADWWT